MMKTELIFLQNLKQNKMIECKNVIVPSEYGEHFIDEKTNKIILKIVPGVLKIKHQDKIENINIENSGVAYFNQKELMIILK
jgi:hypothetical protein